MKFPPMTEDQWKRQVIQLAGHLGWKRAHFRPAKTSLGWRTAVEADGAGFPDLVLVRDRVIFAELKAEKGRLSPLQVDWINALIAADAETYVWRPSMFEDVHRVLASIGRPGRIRNMQLVP